MSLCQDVSLLLPAILKIGEMLCDVETRQHSPASQNVITSDAGKLTTVPDRQLTSILEGSEDPFAGWDAWWRDVDLCLFTNYQGCPVPLYCLGPLQQSALHAHACLGRCLCAPPASAHLAWAALVGSMPQCTSMPTACVWLLKAPLHHAQMRRASVLT